MFINKKINLLTLFLVSTSLLYLNAKNSISQLNATKQEMPKKENFFTQKIEDFVSPDEKNRTQVQKIKQDIHPEQNQEIPQAYPKQNQQKELAPEINSNETLQATKQPPTEQKAKEEPKDIFLNFENTDLTNFINYMAELKKINLVPDKTLQGVKCSLTVRTPLTVDGAWKVFLTILDMGGFSIIKKGDVYVVIPKAQKNKQPLPAYINVASETLPDSDINLRYVTFLQNIGVGEIQDLLKGMLSPEGTVLPYPEVNGLIITDKSYNIKAAMKIINELDQTGLQESVEVIRLQNANATDVKKTFDDLIQKPAENPLLRLLGKQAESTLEYFSPTTRIIAEERTNSLILLGNKKSIQKIEDFIVKYLDTELKGVTSPLHIYELQNTDAESIKSILETVTAPSEEKSKYGAVRGGVKYFKKMNFQVDKDGNRIIASSTDKQDWQLLKRTIEDLDKPQPQVAVETLVASVDFLDSKFLGGSLRNKKEGQIGKGVNFQSPTPNGTIVKDATTDPNNLLGNMINGLIEATGSTILTFGKNTNIWGILQAIKSQTNTTILSQPFFTALNKQKVNLKIGDTLNVVNEKTGGGFEGYAERTAYLDLNIIPQINLEGIVRLNIDINIEDFTNVELGNKSARKVTTDVSVADGQVLVLGGFIRTRADEVENKTPLLGDIPGIGWMFKNKQKTIVKSYIFIFISPTIIKPRTMPGSNLYTRMKLHDATGYIEEAIETRKTKDPIHNWFFNPEGENYSHKVVDFANARYQPTTVDIKNDPYYRATLKNGLKNKIQEEVGNKIEFKEQKEIQEKKEINQKAELKKIISNAPIKEQEEKQSKPISIVEPVKKEELKELISVKPECHNQNKNPSKVISDFISNKSNNPKPWDNPSTAKKTPRKLKSRRNV